MDVLNRTTKAYRRSVNTPDFPTVDWIHSPDMSAVVGYTSKYWIITGDVVTLMAQVDRDALDAAELEQAKDDEADGFDSEGTIFKAAMEVMIDGFNNLRQQFNDTTAESNQLTDTTYTPYTLAQLKAAARSKL